MKPTLNDMANAIFMAFPNINYVSVNNYDYFKKIKTYCYLSMHINEPSLKVKKDDEHFFCFFNEHIDQIEELKIVLNDNIISTKKNKNYLIKREYQSEPYAITRDNLAIYLYLFSQFFHIDKIVYYPYNSTLECYGVNGFCMPLKNSGIDCNIYNSFCGDRITLYHNEMEIYMNLFVNSLKRS